MFISSDSLSPVITMQQNNKEHVQVIIAQQTKDVSMHVSFEGKLAKQICGEENLKR